MRHIFSFSVFLMTSFFLTGCFCGTFTIPESGTAMDQDQLFADTRGDYYLNLESVSEVKYSGFSIAREGLYPLRVYIRRNTKYYADWCVDPLVWEKAELSCIVSSTTIPPALLPQHRNQAALRGFCKGKYGTVNGMENFSVNASDYCGNPAVEYRLTGKNERDEEWMLRGYMLFMPGDPGRLVDVNYYILRRGNSVNELHAYGERFLRSVSFHHN